VSPGTAEQPPVRFLDVDGRRIAFRLRAGASPMLMFLPGYASDMEGTKALALDAWASHRGLGMLRLDYSGTGLSSGAFEGGTLGQWLDEALACLDRLTEGPVIIVGSSMGGWIALHLALRRPERVAAVVGIAAAPDFTDWGFRDGAEAEQRGIAPGFWQSGQELRLLGAPIAIDCPVRMLHGECDEEVPVEVALRLMGRLRSADVQLNILKGAGHRLSEPREIDAIVRAVTALTEIQ
jgi:pimeloyl-ACP methyl ester carboxylesterase